MSIEVNGVTMTTEAGHLENHLEWNEDVAARLRPSKASS